MLLDVAIRRVNGSSADVGRTGAVFEIRAYETRRKAVFSQSRNDKATICVTLFEKDGGSI